VTVEGVVDMGSTWIITMNSLLNMAFIFGWDLTRQNHPIGFARLDTLQLEAEAVHA
jgi:hypothetical protein